ncbi:MAG: hypothetical protein ACRD12_03305 [Acidimicrobiales bacterium]
MRTIVLDNEAVRALIDAGHRKHRVVIAHVAGVAVRRRKGQAVTIVVPTAVRVEAGWDRSDPRRAVANQIRVRDAALDTRVANEGAEIALLTGVSVADAHVGAVVQGLATGDVVFLTSDPKDMERVSAPRPITAIRI